MKTLSIFTSLIALMLALASSALGQVTVIVEWDSNPPGEGVTAYTIKEVTGPTSTPVYTTIATVPAPVSGLPTTEIQAVPGTAKKFVISATSGTGSSALEGPNSPQFTVLVPRAPGGVRLKLKP